MQLRLTTLRQDPFKIVAVLTDSDSECIGLDQFDLHKYDPEIFDKDFLCCAFRSVSFDRLSDVIQNGVDVFPTDSPIYVGDLDKALEYGDWPKVVMALDWNHLKPTYKRVPSDIAESELNELMGTYPTKFESDDGSNFWLTRLSREDRRATTDYESAYGRYIPDNPFQCLKMVMIISRPTDANVPIDLDQIKVS